MTVRQSQSAAQGYCGFFEGTMAPTVKTKNNVLIQTSGIPASIKIELIPLFLAK